MGEGAVRSIPSGTSGKYNLAEPFFIWSRPSLIWFVLQRGIPRRTREDAKHPPNKWGQDRAEPDVVDMYPEEDLPKTRVQRRGKASAESYFWNLADTDTSEDECRILEPLNARPLCSYPGPKAPKASASRVARSASAAPAARSEAQAASRSKPPSRGRGRNKRGVVKGQVGPPPAKKQKVTQSKGPRPSFAG